ncbi:MAG: hypothetical protein QGG97_04370 [Flavobacteriales bacterium]|nr:hypothetical protein [Flavobacteriales bacterium]
MTADVPGENKDKVIRTLRSEAVAQRIKLTELEGHKRISLERKQQAIDYLRSEIVVIRNQIALLTPEKDKTNLEVKKEV